MSINLYMFKRKLYVLMALLLVSSPLAYGEKKDACKRSFLLSNHRQNCLVESVCNQLPLLTSLPKFTFPASVEEVSKLYPSKKVPIFVYGSLMNESSAIHTVSQEAFQAAYPAVAFGLKRLFSRSLPETNYPLKKPSDIGSLNVEATNDLYDLVNGVVITVDENDLYNLINREEGYDLIPILNIAWDDVLNEDVVEPPVWIAYTFSASSDTYVARNINPIPDYVLLVKEGAASYGENFLDFWIGTTYLSDGKTPYCDWENNPDLDLKNSSN